MTLEDAHKNAKGIESYVSNQEAVVLYYTAKQAKLGIVEIGSFKGKSSIYLAQGSLDGNKVPVYCVDTWKDCDVHKGEDFFDEFKKNIEPYKKIIKIKRGESELANTELFELSFDLVFIDGDHSPEGVRKDWELWKPKDGIVFFHDIAGGPRGWIGPVELFRELEQQFETERVTPNLGKVIVRSKKKRLNLGCGLDLKSKSEGWINIDVREIKVDKEKFDFVCQDVAKLAYKEEVDEILANDLIEHFSRHEVLGVLTNWHNALRENGVLVIRCPDIREISKAYASNIIDGWEAARVLYGEQDYPENTHKNGFDSKTIEAILEQAGFSEIIILKAEKGGVDWKNMKVIAKKKQKFKEGLIL